MLVRELAAKLSIKTDKASVEGAKLMFTELRSQLELVLEGVHKVREFIGDLVQKTAGFANEISRMSKITGVSRDSLQRLSFAAEESGVSMESLQHAMIWLSRRGVHDTGGEMLRLADRFKNMTDPAAKARLAMQLFGRSGYELLPMLEKGRDGLQGIIDEGEEAGVFLNGDAFEAAKRQKEAMKAWHASILGIERTLAVPFLKAMSKSVEGQVAFLKANRALINAGLKKALEAIVGVLRAFSSIVSTVTDGVKWLASKLGGTTLAIVAFSAALMLAGDSTVALVVKWFALGAVVALVAEDIIAFLKGQPSLIGDINTALDKWWDNISPLSAIDAEKHPFITFLKTVLYTVREIFRVVGSAIGTGAGKIWELFNPPAGGIQMQSETEAQAEGQKARAFKSSGVGSLRWGDRLKIALGTPGAEMAFPGLANADWRQRLGLAIGAPGTANAELLARVFGGGASPEATAELSNPSPKISSSRTVHQEVNVNVATGASADEIAGHVARALDEFENTQNRQTIAALVPAAP
jgi:hypothetical protein